MSKNVLTFKYLRNCMADLGDNAQYAIPMRTVIENKNGFDIVVPHFDLTKIHEVRLREEHPQLPEREEMMSDRYHSELCDAAYKLARENREYNDEVRKNVHALAKSGTIEIVSDPFSRKTTPDAAETKPLKPSELAKLQDAKVSKTK